MDIPAPEDLDSSTVGGMRGAGVAKAGPGKEFVSARVRSRENIKEGLLNIAAKEWQEK